MTVVDVMFIGCGISGTIVAGAAWMLLRQWRVRRRQQKAIVASGKTWCKDVYSQIGDLRTHLIIRNAFVADAKAKGDKARLEARISVLEKRAEHEDALALEASEWPQEEQ